MQKIRYYIPIIILLLISQMAKGQIASDTIGCVPLLIKFTSPNQALTNVVWDFKDGASSDKLNPNHVYSTPGMYIVTLMSNNELVTQVKVVILPELLPQITIDTNQGCAPLTIVFKNKTVTPNGVSITEYFWDFGDGDGSTIENPSHTYFGVDKFDVTLNIKTNIEQCNTSKTFEDLISIKEKQNVDYIVDSIAPSCVVPTFLYLKYTGIVDPTYSYSWDFGNGLTSDKYQPDPIKYDSEGTYTIVLKVDNNKGCQSKITRSQRIIFSPEFVFDIPDTVCTNGKFNIINTTAGDSFSWNFGANAEPMTSSSKQPVGVKFTKPGTYDILLKVTSGGQCQKDTIIKIFVQSGNADFTIDPEGSCSLPQDVAFTAVDKNNLQYLWNNEPGTYTHSLTIPSVSRDSFYYNTVDSFKMTLIVYSPTGCTSVKTKTYYNHLPNSQFELNNFEGEAPFLLVVNDKSESICPIVTWIYDWGDGTSTEYDASTISQASHLYETYGHYYVNLSIINECGCTDKYFGAWVTVHQVPRDPDPTTCNASGDPFYICVNESVFIFANNVSPLIDAVHFNLGNTLSNCEDSESVLYVANDDPGTYPFGVTLDNGSKFYDYYASKPLIIKGAKAKIGYQVSCTDKLNVFFENKSVNATKVKWIIDGNTITADTFHYLFPSTGDYPIVLIAENEDDGCPADSDQLTIKLRNPKAAIISESNWCEGVPNKLISTPSTDEAVGCSMGYLWSFLDVKKGNIIAAKDTVEASLPRGLHRISLEVRDVNGCRDTAYTDITVNGLTADFEIDKTFLCEPIFATCTDISYHDAAITKYEWSLQPFNNSAQINHKFVSLPKDSFQISLTVTDALGCTSSVGKYFKVYKPKSTITYDSIMCQANTKLLTASDFTEMGSSLSYKWSVDSVATSTSNTQILANLAPGIHKVRLQIIEASTQCTNDYLVKVRVVGTPQAIISGVEDSVYCFPKSLQLFGDKSIVDPFDKVGYAWNFGNNRNSYKLNPVETFRKGQFKITFTIRSLYKCESTVEKTISLVGPEGNLTADKIKVCKGEDITFALSEPKDVSSFFWDFGQGEISNNVSPVSYSYNYVPLSGKTFASLVLQSEQTGCETLLTVPVEIYKIDANFAADSTCTDSLKVVNLSLGENDVKWIYKGNVISTDQNPTFNFPNAGVYPISLSIINNQVGCKDTILRNLTFLDPPNINVLPFVDLCGVEKYTFAINPTDTYDISPSNYATINGSSIAISVDKSVLLTIQATAANGCKASKNIEVGHNNVETSDTLFTVTTCTNSGPVVLPLKWSTGDSITWYLNGTLITQDILSCTNCPNPTLISDIVGELMAQIYNEEQCRKFSITFIIEKVDVEIPNVFSPNNDMANDLFRPVIKNIVNDTLSLENLKIVNRWGKKVYMSDKAWDGIIDGHPGASEVYYFQMTYSVGRYCSNTVKGDVTLIR